MNFKKYAALAAFSLGMTGAAAQAASLDFIVDGSASSVTLTETGGGGFVCSLTDCGITADLATGLDGTAFSLMESGTETFDFLRFEGDGTTGFSSRNFDISATLAFSSPDLAVTSGGNGGAFLLGGSIAGGSLVWDDVPDTFVLDDGSVVDVDFQGAIFRFLFNGDSGVTTGATVTATSVAISPVPLPASGLLLLAGFGGLAAMRRRSVAA